MERINNGSLFSKNTTYYLFSRLFERASFYGFRAILILFMTSNVLDMENQEALRIYGWFTAGMIFTHVLGGAISDLKLGNRNGIILGGIMQASGVLIVSLSTHISLYFGLFVFLMGEGLYTPNLLAQYGKIYLSKSKLLDAGFLLLYVAVIFGSAIGPMLIGYIGDEISWSFGFAATAFLSVCSILFALLLRTKELKAPNASVLSLNLRFIFLIVIFVLMGTYWMVYEIGTLGISNLTRSFSEYAKLDRPSAILIIIDSGFGLPLSIIVLIVWSHFYYNQVKKLAIGFALTALGFGILLFLAKNGSNLNLAIFVTSMFLLSFGEVHLSPIILSLATKYSNPKYLATIMGLSMIPVRGLMYLSGLIILDPTDYLLKPFIICAIVLGILTLSVAIFLRSKIGKSIT